MKSPADKFDEWFETIGVRTFAKDHGSADGHRQYMRVAFLDGYHLALKHFEKMILESDDTWQPEDEYQ